MREATQTHEFAAWFAQIQDRTVRARVDIRIRRLLLGNPGDVGTVGEGVMEMRLHFGPG